MQENKRTENNKKEWLYEQEQINWLLVQHDRLYII